MSKARIDPALVPDVDLAIGCKVLSQSITRALSDPTLRAECEAWKASKEAKQ